MKILRCRCFKRGVLFALTLIGFGVMSLGNPGCAQENAQVLEAMKTDVSASEMVDAVAPVNQVPYLSTYYISPKVDVGKDITIKYYVTNRDQSDYMTDDHSQVFTVDYWVNGTKSTVSKVKIGDNSLTLKPIPVGEVLFALQVTDAQGRKSHRLYQKFLVVDPATAVIPEDKVYHPDLKKFNIYNDDSHPVETTKGLTELLKGASENGYRKVVLPKGRYRIDENNTVEMATRLTLDMNGSTFKLNPNALDKSMMFEMANCFDSHVINGTFEGDLEEHDFKKASRHSEWVDGIDIAQGSRYCSFENVTVLNVTGTGAKTNSGSVRSTTYSAVRPKKAGEFIPGDVNEKGEVVASEVRNTTKEMKDISPFLDPYGFIQLGVYLGYQGNPAGNWVYKASFYDADKKFIENIEGYMYRRLYLPKNAKFARFTVYSTASAKRLSSLSLFNFRPPYNCSFIDVHFENVRCVGMSPTGFNNLLVEGNTFKNCGWAQAKCAFDSEDGWNLMQDLTFRNNTFLENPHNEFLTAAGHNFVMENNTMKVYMWDRTQGAVYRNNTIKSATFRFGKRDRTGLPRIYDNVIEGNVSLASSTGDPDCEFAIRDNVIKGNAGSSAGKNRKPNAFFYKCKIEGGRLNAKVVACEIKDIKNVGGTFKIYDSTIENSVLKSSGHVLAKIVGSTITNSHLSTQGGTMLLENNTIIDSEGTAGGDWSDGHEWILINNKVTTSLKHLVRISNSYKQVVLKGNSVTSTDPAFVAVSLRNPTKDTLVNQSVTLVDNTFNAQGGLALDVNKMPNAAATLTVHLFGNKYNGITEINEKALDAPNIKIVREKPVEG